MKININTPAWTVEYTIDSEYGLLECTFYPEKTAGHFNEFFSSMAVDVNDYLSVNPSFEPYVNRATELFAKVFPERLKALLEETIDEVRLNTVIELKQLKPKEARSIIKEALANAEREKKDRMNAPGAGRPQEWTETSLKTAVIEILNNIPSRRNPTLAEVAKKLNLKSEDALRKLLKRYNLEWKELKKRT